MAVLKPREIDAFVAKPNLDYRIFMLFGPDLGLVSERASELAKKTGVDLSDPFNLIRLSAEEATSDPLKITDEANTIGMFGGKRLIRISGSTNRDLFKCLKPVLDTPPEDAWIIVEAGDLNKSSALRRNLEKHKSSICIPCYQDNVAALEKLIDDEIVKQGFSINHETRAELRSQLGDNRMLSRNELKKLTLYCEGKPDVTLEDIRAVVGDGSALVATEIADAAATGNTAKLQTLLPKAIEAGNKPDIILQNCLKHFQTLQRMRSQIEQSGKSAEMLIKAARPPLHFSRHDAVRAALANWPNNNLAKALKRLDSMMLECRRNTSAAASIAGTALLAVSLEAQSLRRR